MTHRRYLQSLLLAGIIAGIAPAAAAENNPDEQSAPADLLPALQAGGYVIYLRHTATNHDQIDAPNLKLADCATQRNLSEKGREQAEEIGRSFERLEIPVGEVVTSPYCRTADTARLAFGGGVSSDALGYTIRDDARETQARAASLREMLSTTPPAGLNTVIVGHTANLKEAAGIWPPSEGTSVIFRPSADGGFAHVATLEPEVWSAFSTRN